MRQINGVFTNEKSARKPYNDDVGYVCMLGAELGRYVVIYDRSKWKTFLPGQKKWLVVNKGLGLSWPFPTIKDAREAMKKVSMLLNAEKIKKILPNVGTPEL